MITIALVVAQLSVAQTASTATPVSDSGGAIAVSTPAPVSAAALRAPILMTQRVAFVSTEAVRIEWDTDHSAAGEVRYGTVAPLAYTAKAPVFAPSQAVTIDASVFDPKDALYYQLYWVDRQGLSGLSEVRPVAKAEKKLAPATEVEAAPGLRFQRSTAKPRASQLLVFGGPAYRGKHWTWNGGAAFRPRSLPIEAALEGSQYSNVHTHGYPSVTLTSRVGVTHLGARVSYLYPLRWLRGPRGERVVFLPGFVRVGAGIALYLTKTHDLETHELEPHRNQDVTERDTAASPFVELGLGRRIGSRLEAQAAVGYAVSRVQFGSSNYRPGGLFATLQLACRLK